MSWQSHSERSKTAFLLALGCCGGVVSAVAFGPRLTAIGVFESHQDIGITPRKGSVEYNPSTGEYRVTGGGSNIWASLDAFQFAWKRLSGDFTFTADVQFVGAGAVAHRKAVLMIRQSLAPDAAYADVALHGDGLTALQYRPSVGAATQEIRSTLAAARQIRIERRGNRFTIYAAKAGESSTSTGPVTVDLRDPVYVGVGVCSHAGEVLETAVFSNVRITPGPTRDTRSSRKVVGRALEVKLSP